MTKMTRMWCAFIVYLFLCQFGYQEVHTYLLRNSQLLWHDVETRWSLSRVPYWLLLENRLWQPSKAFLRFFVYVHPVLVHLIHSVVRNLYTIQWKMINWRNFKSPKFINPSLHGTYYGYNCVLPWTLTSGNNCASTEKKDMIIPMNFLKSIILTGLCFVTWKTKKNHIHQPPLSLPHLKQHYTINRGNTFSAHFS